MKIVPTDKALGAFVLDIDITHGIDEPTVKAIRQAWLDNQVLVFPDQMLSFEALEEFTALVGNFGEDPFVAAMEGHPHILELRREPDEKAVNFGASWHSDWSFQKMPPSATILHSKVVPPVGGDTLFADGYSAYDALERDLQIRLRGLRGIHSARGPYSKQGFYANEDNVRSIKILSSDKALETTAHPIVRLHPETGREALFVNQVYTIGIEGMEDDESAKLLEDLFRHCTQDKFVYHHRWSPNMLVMWDNRCVQHFAEGGYDGHLRIMHRTTVQGDIPR